MYIYLYIYMYIYLYIYIYKKCVFRRALKANKQADVFMLLGRVIHTVAAATTNELSPAFTCVRETLNSYLYY